MLPLNAVLSFLAKWVFKRWLLRGISTVNTREVNYNTILGPEELRGGKSGHNKVKID